MAENVEADTNLVEQRLSAIVQALDGQNVGADDKELWFEPKGSSGLQIRLGADRQARCYDRSLNFGISYGGEPRSTPVSADFRDAVARIKAIDNSLIDGIATAFGPAAQAVAHHFAPASSVAGGDAALHFASPSEREAIEGASRPMGSDIRSVIVVGGGTAGYFAALALKRQLPQLDVTLVESSKIPIIGVGEATTAVMPPFLHGQLGIDIVELYREVRPTWKLGIKFDWGAPGDSFFTYPFGVASPIEAYAHDGTIANQSVQSMMIAADRVPIVVGEDGEPFSLLPQMKFAYHLDNKPFVTYLATLARRAGIHHMDAEITDVVTTPDLENVERLILDDGRELRGDLYVDASGFRALIIEKALGSPFISFASSLFCDSAVVGVVPQHGPIQPYTTAETMDAGWCWRIPVEGEDHRGYVYSSAHLTAEQAVAEMRAKNPRLGDTWPVRFRSGRHREFWKGNTVAVGNAYGFVEPLESTALHMVIVELAYLVGGLQAATTGRSPRSFANEKVGAHWDFIRWFLAVHYKYNRKSDTDFWRTCRETVDISGLEQLIERFCTLGPWEEESGLRYATGDPSFGFEGLMMMLLGQHVPCPPATRTVLSKAQWDLRVAQGQALVEQAMDQGQALELLRRQPEILRDLVTSSSSWLNLGGEVIAEARPGAQIISPRCDSPTEQRLPYHHLFRGLEGSSALE